MATRKVALISLKNESGCPPLGLVQLATYRGADLIDLNWVDYVPLWYDEYGISAMTKDYGNAVKLAKMIRKSRPKVPIIIGGVHISTLPESFNTVFTDKVIGEGEGFHKDLDDLPRPDWSLVNPAYFDYKPNTTWGTFCREGVMITSRGCPYKCVFCSTQKFWGNKVRFHSAEYVAGLVNDLRERSVTHIQIWDDLFTLNKERLKKITSLVKRWNMSFNCQPRTDLIDDEMCQILKDMGVKTCIFGFESGNQKVLSYLKRNTTLVEDNYNAVRMCRKYGLNVQGSVIFGAPNEGSKEAQDTLNFMHWAYKQGAQRIWAFNLTPFPGTELWNNVDWRKQDFDWSQLSHQRNRPFFVRGIENKFKRRKAWMFIKNNPFRTIGYSLKNLGEIKNIICRNT